MQGTQLSTLPIIDPLKPQSITLQPFQLQNQDEQVPVQKKTLGQRIFAYTEFNPQWMVTSDTVSSKTLYKMRSMAALYMLIVLIYCFVKYWTDFEQFFKFWNTYTHLSFVALFFYFVSTAILTFMYTRNPNNKHQHLNPVLHTLFWIYYHCLIVATTFVTIVYWCLLFPFSKLVRTPDIWWGTISEHGIQLVFALIEISLNKMQMKWLYIWHFLGVLLLYIIQSIIRNAIYGDWPYFFMDYNKPFYIFWYFALLVVLPGFFALVLMLHRLRDRVISRRKQKNANSLGITV